MSTFVNCTDPSVFRLLLPLTNSDWRSSTWTCRRCCFSRLPWPGGLAASSGFTSTSSRMILRNTPDLVEPQTIMTSSQNTCRINSLRVAGANDVNAAEICASNPREFDFRRSFIVPERIPWNQQVSVDAAFCSILFSIIFPHHSPYTCAILHRFYFLFIFVAFCA